MQIQFLNHEVIKGPSAGMKENACKQTRKKLKQNNKKMLFSVRHSLLLSASIKTKVIKTQCLEIIITAIVCQRKGPSHPSSFLQ